MKKRAEIISMSGKLAELKTEAGTLTCPAVCLPEGSSVGDEVWIDISKTPEHVSPEDILNELLNDADSPHMA